MPNYSVGDRVIAKVDIWEPTTGDLPGGLIASAGDVLEIRRVSAGDVFPLSVAHPHREPSAMFGVTLDEIEAADAARSKP